MIVPVHRVRLKFSPNSVAQDASSDEDDDDDDVAERRGSNSSEWNYEMPSERAKRKAVPPPGILSRLGAWASAVGSFARSASSGMYQGLATSRAVGSRYDDDDDESSAAVTETAVDGTEGASYATYDSDASSQQHVVLHIALPKDRRFPHDLPIKLYAGDGKTDPSGASPFYEITLDAQTHESVSRALNRYKAETGIGNVVCVGINFGGPHNDEEAYIPFEPLEGSVRFLWASHLTGYKTNWTGASSSGSGIISNVGVIVHFPDPTLPYASVYLCQRNRLPLHGVSVYIQAEGSNSGSERMLVSLEAETAERTAAKRARPS